jgi:hypothetical protein
LKPAGQIVHEILSQKTLHKNRADAWLKAKDMSSSPSTEKKTKFQE